MLGDEVHLDARPVTIDRAARTTIIACVLSAYAAMGLYLGIAAVQRAGIPAGFAALLGVLAGVCGVASLAALLVAGIERATRSDDAFGVIWSRRATLLWQTLLMLGAAPLLAGSIYVVADALRQYPIVGPTPGTWFATIGTSASFGVPLAALIVALLGHAARQRSPSYALAAALLVNLLTTIVFLVELARGGRPLDSAAWINLAQINAIAAALFSLAWLAGLTRWGQATSSDDATSTAALLRSYIAFAVALCGATVAWGVVYLSIFPDSPSHIAAAGDARGWIALVLNAAAVFWMSRRAGIHFAFSVVVGLLGVVVSMLALTAVGWDRGNWLAYHTLLAGFAVASCSIPVLARVFRGGNATAATRAASLFAAVTVALSLRALWGDPHSPWWTVAGLLAMAALSAVLAWQASRRRFVWATAGLLNLAASVWWIESGHRVLSTGGAGRCWTSFTSMSLRQPSRRPTRWWSSGCELHGQLQRRGSAGTTSQCGESPWSCCWRFSAACWATSLILRSAAMTCWPPPHSLP